MKRIVTMTVVNTDAATGIKTNTDVRAMLEALGWHYDGHCNCNGQYNDKYILKLGAGLEYKMKVRRTSFLLRNPTTSNYIKYPIALLKTTVDEIKELGE